MINHLATRVILKECLNENWTNMGDLILQIKVKPRAKVSELLQTPDGTWIAKIKAPPVDGKANEELVALVAEKFKCSKAAVAIKAGASSRIKIVQVAIQHRQK